MGLSKLQCQARIAGMILMLTDLEKIPNRNQFLHFFNNLNLLDVVHWKLGEAIDIFEDLEINDEYFWDNFKALLVSLHKILRNSHIYIPTLAFGTWNDGECALNIAKHLKFCLTDEFS